MDQSRDQAITQFYAITRTKIGQVTLLVVVAACLFFAGLGRLPLLEPDEGRNAEVAREMLVSGDWVTPHFDTLPYLDKPAVFFWLVAGSFRVWGISEFSARFPSALMALGTVLLVWFLAQRMFGASAGLRAGLVFATSPLALIFSRLVIFDMTLTFLITLVMVSYWLAEAGDFRNARLDVMLFAAMGVAIITKGPVAFLLPLLSIVAYQGVRGRLRELARLRWGIGSGVFLAVTLPWFLAVSIRNPDFPRYAFWQESLLRFATGHSHRGGGAFYYVPVFLGGFLPWSFCLCAAGWNRLKGWRRLREEVNRTVLFLLAWVIVIFVFFSLSHSKLPGYILPATIPLSILMTKVWSESESLDGAPRRDWLTAGFSALMLLGLLVAGGPQLFRLALESRLKAKVHPRVLPLLGPSLLFSGITLLALGVLGRSTAVRARGKALAPTAFAFLALTAPLLAVRWIVPLKIYASVSSSRRLAEALLASPERGLPVYGYYYFRTSLPFYLRRPVGLVTADGDETTSNYVAARFEALRALGARSVGPTHAGSHPHQQVLGAGSDAGFPGSNGPAEPTPRSSPTGTAPLIPVLIDAKQLRNLAENSGQPFLLMVAGSNLTNLMREVGEIDPLWTAWQYSVWKAGGRGVRGRGQAVPNP